MMDLLRFRFTAQDGTGPAWRNIRDQLRGVDGALSSVNERVRRVGRSMRNVGAGLSAGLTAPLTLLGAQSLQLYDTQVKAEAAVRQAILSTGGAANLTAGELGAMASQLQGLTTFGDEDILQNVTAPLLTFTKVQGDVFARAQSAVLDMATLLQMDLRSASVQVGKALNDPIQGITALSRAGVQFSEEQEAMIRSLVETGDVAAAQAIILSELETQFKGQAAAAAATPLGQWQQLSNAIGDVKEQLGEQIAPFLGPLVARVQAAVDWFAALSPEVKQTIVVVGGLAAALGPVVTVLGLATIGVGSLTGAIGTMGAVLLANPVIAIIAAIAAGAYLIYRNWDEIVAWFTATWDRIRETVVAGWARIKSALDEYTPDWLKLLWAGLVDFYAELWDRIAAGVRLGWEIIKGLFTGEYTVAALITDAWAGLVEWFEALWPRVAATFTAFWDGLKSQLAAWPEQFFRTGQAMIDRMIAGIRDRLPFLQRLQDDIGMNVASSIGGQLGINPAPANDLPQMTAEQAARLYGTGQAMGSAVEQGARDALGIHSPSRVFASIGADTMSGLQLGLEGGTDEVLNALRATSEDMGSVIQNAPFVSKLQGWITQSKSVAEFFRSMLADMGQNLMNFALNRAWQGVAQNMAALSAPGGGGGLLSTLFGAALGAVPGGGSAMPFAQGGVFAAPMRFPMGNGKAGVMAENGAEAIMPLTRIGGKLGVRAIEPRESGGAVNVAQSFNIVMEGGGHDDPDRILAALRPAIREEAAKVFARNRRERVS